MIIRIIVMVAGVYFLVNNLEAMQRDQRDKKTPDQKLSLPPLVPKKAWGLEPIDKKHLVNALFRNICRETLSSGDDTKASIGHVDFVKEHLRINGTHEEVEALIAPHEKEAFILFFRTLFFNAHDHGGYLLVIDMINLYKEASGVCLEAYQEVLQQEDIRVLYERQPADDERELYGRAQNSISENVAEFKRLLVAPRVAFEE